MTGRPDHLTRLYSRNEWIADAVVHLLGNVFAVSALVAIIATGYLIGGPPSWLACLVYAGTLMTALSISAAYNLWPDSPLKWWLRRFDHSAIFLLIAGTYTPFLLRMPQPWISVGMLAAVWIAALAGVAMKVLLPGRFDRLAIGLYLALGWSGIVVAAPIMEEMPRELTLILIGGMLYSLGVLAYVRESLPFHNVIWHGFVLAAAAVHFAAVMMVLVTPA